MITRLSSASERLSRRVRRWLVVVLPIFLLVMLFVVLALVPGWVGRSGDHGAAGVLPPTAGSASSTAVAIVPAGRPARASATQPAGTRPRSTTGDVGPMVAVARRFADAYVAYESAQLPGWVRSTIEQTTTSALDE
jgi:hypothetical protein